MRLFREKQFEHLGLGSVDLLGPVANIEDIGYCNKTQSIDVISGVYVAIEADFNEAKSVFYHYGIHHLLKLLSLMIFVFLAVGWPLRVLDLVVSLTSWRKVFMQLRRTGVL